MSDDQLVLHAGNGSIVAPAGYGKTETIGVQPVGRDTSAFIGEPQ